MKHKIHNYVVFKAPPHAIPFDRLSSLGHFSAPIPLKSLVRVPNLSPPQNKKYRCAIGSVSAGSQTRSTPSAVTA